MHRSLQTGCLEKTSSASSDVQDDRGAATEYLANDGCHVSGQRRSELFAPYGVTHADEDNSAPLRNILALTGCADGLVEVAAGKKRPRESALTPTYVMWYPVA
jgi:hypothetical protein